MARIQLSTKESLVPHSLSSTLHVVSTLQLLIYHNRSGSEVIVFNLRTLLRFLIPEKWILRTLLMFKGKMCQPSKKKNICQPQNSRRTEIGLITRELRLYNGVIFIFLTFA